MMNTTNEHDRAGRCIRHPHIQLKKRRAFVPGTGVVLKWKVILGEYPELTARGIPPTGTENYGGPLVTASGLIFIGATADETFRVFDKENGKTLFQTKLPFSGNATPSTYMVNGRQYVVISAGGGKSGRPRGGSLVAFALPE